MMMYCCGKFKDNREKQIIQYNDNGHYNIVHTYTEFGSIIPISQKIIISYCPFCGSELKNHI